MIASLFAAALIPPPVPPYGPVRVNYNCLVETMEGEKASWVLIGEEDQHQVMFNGPLPTNGRSIGSMALFADRFQVDDVDGNEIFTIKPVHNGLDGAWHAMTVPTDNGPERIGICYAQNGRGRKERPISFSTSISIEVN